MKKPSITVLSLSFFGLVLLYWCVPTPWRLPDFLLEHSVGVALCHGENWGRQALVGAPACPFLPTLLLCPFALAGWEKLFLSLFQGGCVLALVCRIPQKVVGSYRNFLVMAACAAGWCLSCSSQIVPLTLLLWGLFFGEQYWKGKELKHGISSTLCCGALVLCGPVWACVGILGALLLTARRLAPLLAATPGLWCCLLLLLWNWLILGNPLYRYRCLTSAGRYPSGLSKFRTAIPALPVDSPYGVTLLCGTWIPALYRGTPQTLASLDFSVERTRKLAAERPVKLLLPPPELKLQEELPELVRYYHQGASWLILDEVLPGEWRLYSVLPE